MADLQVRAATPDDVPALTAVRRHYVLHTHAVFRLDPPTEQEVAAWVAGFDDDPSAHLVVATAHDVVVGYASGSAYRPTPAFDATRELSVYRAPDHAGPGVGGALYADLLPRLARSGARTVVAGVALPNDASLAFHRRHGFTEVGTFRDYARKGERWISSTWFQRHL